MNSGRRDGDWKEGKRVGHAIPSSCFLSVSNADLVAIVKRNDAVSLSLSLSPSVWVSACVAHVACTDGSRDGGAAGTLAAGCD